MHLLKYSPAHSKYPCLIRRYAIFLALLTELTNVFTVTVLIVDDNEIARIALRNMVRDVQFLELAGECESATEAFNFLKKQRVDLLLLDIEMPTMNGLEFIRSLTDRPLSILVSSKTEYALDGHELHVVDYLVKPVNFSRFLAAVQYAHELKALKETAAPVAETMPKDDPGFLFARVNNQLIRINYGDILYIQAYGDYVVLHTPGKKHPVHYTLKAVEDRLPNTLFARVHRSYIVAVDKVNSLEDNSILIGKDLIPLSENYKAAFLKKMNML